MSIECTAFKVRRLSRVVTQAFDTALRPYGIKVTQLSLLTALVDKGPMSVVELADLLSIDPTTASRATASVASLGWITISDGKDARSKRVALTPKGESLYREAIGARNEAERHIRKTLKKAVPPSFLADLETAANALSSGHV